MRIVFMGTPDFAVPSLKALKEAGHVLAAVVTRPDRPRGRGKINTPTPVKETALALGIPVLQPLRIKDPEFIGTLRGLDPEIVVVVAYGQILPAEILSLPPFGCINVHASLLPKYRGAAPIHRAVINGEKETGVTTMYMDEGMDTGDLILKESIQIHEEDTVGIITTVWPWQVPPAEETLVDFPGHSPDSQNGEPLYSAEGGGGKSVGQYGQKSITMSGMNPGGSPHDTAGKGAQAWRTSCLESGRAGAIPGEVVAAADGILVVPVRYARILELQAGGRRLEAADF